MEAGVSAEMRTTLPVDDEQRSSRRMASKRSLRHERAEALLLD